jgi:hypothetical protein
MQQVTIAQLIKAAFHTQQLTVLEHGVRHSAALTPGALALLRQQHGRAGQVHLLHIIYAGFGSCELPVLVRLLLNSQGWTTAVWQLHLP